MSEEVERLRNRALTARIAYNLNHITREEAYQDIIPFIELYNKKAHEIAKKYNMRPKLMNFASFVR